MAGMDSRPATPALLELLNKVRSHPNVGGQACCPISGQTPAEESVNALTHGVGLLLSIAGLSLLVTLASFTGNPWYIVGSAIFGSTLVLVYAGSTLYHASRSTRPIVSKNREVMKSKAQTGERLGRVFLYVTKRSPVWNAAIRACRI